MYMNTCIHLLLYIVIVILLLSFRTSGFIYVIHHTLIYVNVLMHFQSYLECKRYYALDFISECK